MRRIHGLAESLNLLFLLAALASVSPNPAPAADQVDDASAVTVQFQYTQPDPLPSGPFFAADYTCVGFILRGPLFCGMVVMPCPDPEMRHDPKCLPPGDYSVGVRELVSSLGVWEVVTRVSFTGSGVVPPVHPDNGAGFPEDLRFRGPEGP